MIVHMLKEHATLKNEKEAFQTDEIRESLFDTLKLVFYEADFSLLTFAHEQVQVEVRVNKFQFAAHNR